jgi:pimeloyl-ACP methyl ester carboxylesterase
MSDATNGYPVDLATLHWGDPDAPLQVLIVHGLTASGAAWWRVADGLATAGWSVTAVDLRGHGVSPRTTSYSLTEHSGDLIRIRTREGGPWDLVIAHSMGGAISALTAAAHPEWTRRLLLIDPALAVPPEAREAMLGRLLSEPELEIEQYLSANPRWTSEDAVQKVSARRAVSPYVIEQCVRDPGWQVEGVVAEIAVPVRILGADHGMNPSFTPAQAERVLAANDRVSYAEVVGAPHAMYRDDPQRIVDEALAFAAG